MHRLKKLYPLLPLAIFLLLVATMVRQSVLVPEQAGTSHVYFELVFLLLLAAAGELALTYVNQPSVMVLLVLGVLASPSVVSLAWSGMLLLPLPFNLPAEAPKLFQNTEVLQVFAQLGAIILLFKVGLENTIEKVFSWDNLLVAACGVVVPFAAGYAYAAYTEPGNVVYAMFVGAALTATSVGVTVAILKELKLVNERFANVIIGAAVIDDVLGLLVLSFVLNLQGGTVALQPILVTSMTAIVFFAGCIAASEYFVKYLDRKDMSARRFILVIAFMLFYAYLAEFIKLSAIVGAFLAGVTLNKSRHVKELNEKTYGLELFFMPIFFISLGMLVDVNSLRLFAVPILVLTVIAAASKALGCFLASLWAKMSMRESVIVGVGMIPRGEVALIVASIGLSGGLLTSAQYSIITAMAFLTTLAVPPMLVHLLRKKAQAHEQGA